MFNFHTTRPCKIEMPLSMKESERLKEIAKEVDLPEWRVLLQALRQYDAVHSGNAELVFKDTPFGCMGED